MLTPGIFQAYEDGVAHLAANPAVKTAARGLADTAPNRCQSALFVTDAESFLADETLGHEVFGAASLVIRCRDLEAIRALVAKMQGQLTITLQMDEADTDAARALLPTLERKAGRLLVNGWPTGVEVCHAMVHGGPFPATSDSRTTSVGTLAIRRFLRPVCYQDFPADLLPAAIKDDNPLGLWRRTDGVLGKN
jgi:NADP-dependent aldehyde dehydrogenase